MITTNPFSELAAWIPSGAQQAYVVAMFLLVAGGTILDMVHKKSAKYFFENSEKAKKQATKTVGGGEAASIAFKTVAEDVLTSAEFCNPHRRIAHLLTMYGFILFVVSTAIMIFSYTAPGSDTPVIWPLFWHLGALMVCVGGYWFWFAIRVDVAAEGNPWYRVVKADLFILSLLACTTFGLLWSLMQAVGATGLTYLFFGLFVMASTVLFGGVLWSKFAHMFFKPAAAFEKRMSKANGSRNNLPPPADKPEQFGLGIKRELPRHY
ncbi:MAG: adenylyl-sulfate reductase [Granulosicoccus sp.]